MSQKRIQLFFILGVLAITLHFTLLFSGKLFHYLSLNRTSSARITQWEIVPVKKCFGLQASYTFDAQGKTWQGISLLSPPYPLNEISALAELKKRAKEPWQAHYKGRNPQYSALEKSFPWNLLIRLVCCVGVVVYLFFLKLKITKNLFSSNQ